MKIRYMSDLHLEFERYSKRDGTIINKDSYFVVPPQDDDADTILILAGDVAIIERPHTYMHFLETVGKQFKEVLYVMGNHEFYCHGVFQTAIDKLKTNLENVNIRVLQDDSVIIDGHKFFGATLWTNFNKGNPLTMYQAAQYMSDYKQIVDRDPTNNFSKLKTSTIYAAHLNTVAKLEAFLANNTGAIVITHHLPSYKSVNEQYHGDYSNYFYYSDLDELMAIYKPKLWFHGHTHRSCEYTFFDTTVCCNPRGYLGEDLNYEFDPNKYVVI
jgi:Icc-related predicted phosphoesterase